MRQRAAVSAECPSSNNRYGPTSGAAFGRLGDEPFSVQPGQVLVVPPGVDFEVHAGDAGFEAIVYMAVGGQAIIAGGEPFTPPWAL